MQKIKEKTRGPWVSIPVLSLFMHLCGDSSLFGFAAFVLCPWDHHSFSCQVFFLDPFDMTFLTLVNKRQPISIALSVTPLLPDRWRSFDTIAWASISEFTHFPFHFLPLDIFFFRLCSITFFCTTSSLGFSRRHFHSPSASYTSGGSFPCSHIIHIPLSHFWVDIY